jgi:tRNA pseudouridine38-40 synthase
MGGERNIRLVLEYEGGGYHGWQIQPGALTVQEVLEECIFRITQHPSRVTAAGRTDAGVHALQQVVHFHTPSRLPDRAIRQGLNALLPADIRVLHGEEVAWAFHARFSALGKRYEYRFWNGPSLSVFSHRYSWWISRPLDVEAMERAARQLMGEHDFSSFRSAGCEGRNAVRDVRGCGWEARGPLLRFWIEANGFLRYMVRTIVGTLVEVGTGKRPAEDLGLLLEARDRSLAGPTAPARGLFLTCVRYPPPWELETVQGMGWPEEAPFLGKNLRAVSSGGGEP